MTEPDTSEPDTMSAHNSPVGQNLSGKILAGKTLFITGASRGIGAAIASRFAAAGANVALCSKTLEQHPTLPGSLQQAAEEIRAAGGNALPLVVDVRDEAQIAQAVAQTVERFGGIDICVNNAAAFHMQPSMQTPAKRHDLLFAINERGTFLTTQACYPHLQQAENPHILNLSPPLDLRPVWFQYTSAYSVSKYAVSLYTLGWAREFAQDGIAVNSLWPRTGIDTPAASFHGSQEMRREFRHPAIMADAALHIVSRPSDSFSGNFCIDDSLLHTAGVTDFAPYSVSPGTPLVPDYFVPADSEPPPGVELGPFHLYPLD